MVEIAVVDDEKEIREHICRLIERQKPGSRIRAYAAGEELLAAGDVPDMVFLDVRMPGMNGIETARSLRKRREEIILIFLTGLKEYVFDAFDLYAFQYLLKPVDEKKFAEVLERACTEAGRRKGKQELFIKARNLTLDQADILYIESRGKKVEIHTVRDWIPSCPESARSRGRQCGMSSCIEIYASMEELAGQLGEGFYRCHRAYIVNMAHITEYGSDSIILTNGDSVYLAKKKYGEFVKAYMWYLQNGGVSCV